MTDFVCCDLFQSYDIMPSQDLKGKSIVEKQNRALLCGITKKAEATEYVQGSLLFPNLKEGEEEVRST